MAMDWQAAQEEAVEHLRELVRIDTTNPPGNETAAARYVAGVLEREGIPAHVVESAPGRGNVVARLEPEAGGGEGALLLLSHLDVVPAEPERWRYPPFEGVLADGYVWGRGTLDTKGLTAAELMAMVLLKRHGLRLRRPLVLAATADEEAGGQHGLSWLVEQHPDLVACEYALNEGGGEGLEVGDRRLYLCQTAEKGVCWIELVAHGQTGHAAFPHNANPVQRLGRAVGRLGPASLPIHPLPLVRDLMGAWLETLGPGAPAPETLLAGDVCEEMLEPYFGPLARSLNAMLRNTVTPTRLEAGVRINVIPGEARAELDGRILPGMSQEEVVGEVRAAIGPDADEVEVRVKLFFPAAEGGTDHALYSTIEEVMGELDPGCRVLPYLVVGVTDGRFLMRRGVRVCGFAPLREDPLAPLTALIHGDDERISVENVGFGVRALTEIAARFCG